MRFANVIPMTLVVMAPHSPHVAPVRRVPSPNGSPGAIVYRRNDGFSYLVTDRLVSDCCCPPTAIGAGMVLFGAACSDDATSNTVKVGRL